MMMEVEVKLRAVSDCKRQTFKQLEHVICLIGIAHFGRSKREHNIQTSTSTSTNTRVSATFTTTALPLARVWLKIYTSISLFYMRPVALLGSSLCQPLGHVELQ